MEKKPSFVLQLSLQEMALRRVVVQLWSEKDILSSIVNFRNEVSPDQESQQAGVCCSGNGISCISLQEMTGNKVKVKVANLVLPESLKQQMMLIIKPIGAQILRWRMSFCQRDAIDSSEDWDIDILEQLYWTTIGTVDYGKTAENLVRLKTLDVVRRYKLASLYCLTDSIPVLWKELPEEYKKNFWNEKGLSLEIEELLEFYWAYVAMEKVSELRDMVARRFGEEFSIHRYVFESSARKGNKAATEYFFQKFSREERDTLFLRTVYPITTYGRKILYRQFYDFPIEKLSEVLYYLFSQMSSDRLMQILKTSPAGVLTCFLDWPWQDLFLKISDLIWTFLSKDRYEHLIDDITENILHSGYYFPEVFQKFFLHSPVYFRKCFVEKKYQFCSILSLIFNAEDTETVKIVFRNIDDEDRVKLVCGYTFFRVFDGLVKTNKWHLAELCLREATPFKGDKNRLKKAYTEFFKGTIDSEYTTGGVRAESRRLQWKRFFELLDEIDSNAVPMGKEALTKVYEAEQ